uniref:Uncharacterized protein n=1 Tax=Penaeus semisulcatus majanivirus TaxID=2984274 RepID=A0A9C7BM07_9VIRU|nr:MAG: hypothetical protein [Penaeus semisulcatus majanivirus]
MSNSMASVIVYQKKMQLLVDAFDSGIDKIMREWNLDDKYYGNLLDIEFHHMQFECDRAKDIYDFVRLVETVIDSLRIYQIPPYQIDETIRDMRKSVNNTMLMSIPISKHDVTNAVHLINEQDHLERYANHVKDTVNQHISDRWKAVENRRNVLIKKLEHIKHKLVKVYKQFNTVHRRYFDSIGGSPQRATSVEHQNSTLELPTFIRWYTEERNA